MKIRKLLPVLVLLALALSLCLLAGCAVQNTAPAAEKPAAQGQELTLITPTPVQTPKPAQSPKPTPVQTPKPVRTPKPSQTPKAVQEPEILDENGSYTTKDDVALYIHTYGHLPPNFITKKEAQMAGWVGGSLEQVLPRGLLRQLRGAASQGQGAQMGGMRHQHPRQKVPRAGAHHLLQRRPDLLYPGPLRDL